MRSQKIIIIMAYAVVVIFILDDGVLFVNGMATSEKKELKEKVLEMFMHAYRSYMNNAYPADELMPLSCKGRYRGTEPNRGDIDDSLGNFTLTLIDTLDTLVVLGELEEFDKAVRLVIGNTKFDADVVVSVFETNIRVLGGLLGGHVLAAYLKKKKKAMEWYNDELLAMAKDVGYRLLPAFNTSTGIPYSRINLKHGISDDIHDRNRDTCTACAGTIILEFAALSRLTNEEIFEEKAHKAMDYLWKQRHRSSDLVGTVLNVHTGDWIRRESGVGAGIDSYYEYVLKAYILLGDDIYLNRFNKHYSAVMKYISQGPMLLDVHMHKPHAASRNFMDALLAFWPGLQVLKGDIQPAIKTHEMLYQLIQKHNFLPEAFTTDFRVHWGHHPLRPEFVESTYFLHKATGDSHYLRVGKRVVENMNNLARVPCGFAGIKDVSTGGHEDQMDSYVFAETFKYLYLLFAEESDLVINIDDYLFTTEAHLLPLSLSVFNASAKVPKIRREVYNKMQDFDDEEYYEANVDTSYTEDLHHSTCPNPQYLYKNTRYYAHNLRTELQGMVEKISPPQFRNSHRQRLRASEFIAGNKAQLEMLHDMGIRIATMSDGRVQLLHSATDATSPQDAEDGMRFMQEMIELSRQQQNEPQLEPSVVQFLSSPYFGSVHFLAGTAQFGYNLKKNPPVQGSLAVAEPFNACQPITNPLQLSGHIAILERGNCMFVDKARNLQLAGAVGGIVIDHTEGSTSGNQPLFAMSGDGTQDVIIPMVFLYHKEGQQVIGALKAANYNLQVLLASRVKDPKELRHSTDDEQSQHSLQAEGPPVDHSTTDSSTQQASGTSDCSNENILIKQEETPKKVFQHLQSLQHVSGNAQKHYKIMAGSSNVEIEVKDGEKETNLPKEQQVSDKYIEIVSLHDGSKQIQFNFAHLGNKKAQTKPELNQIYVEIVNILQTKTNFNKLDNQADYLMAIARLLEAAYFGLEKVDANAQRLFDKLTNELEIIEKEENNEILQSADSDTIQSENSLHFSSSDAENDQSDESLHSGSFDDKNDQSADFSQGSNEPEGDQTDEVKIREILSDNDHAQHYATSQDFSEVNEPIQELGAEEVENKNTFHVHLDNDNNNIEKSENIEHDYSEIQNNMQETQSHKHTSKIPASLENNDPTPRDDSLNDKSESSDDERTLNIETNTDINKPHRTNDEL